MSSISEYWSTFAPYVVPPFAAGVAIVPAFPDMAAKSAKQRGQAVPSMSLLEGLRSGVKAAPTVGVIVGTQMVVQGALEKTFASEDNKKSIPAMLASSAVVGTLSAPVLAVFNGQTMGWRVRESLRKFSVKQGSAIAVQETAFVAGLSAADRLAEAMKARFGDNKAVEYAAAFTAGAFGSLAGHPANTALTRWQSGMKIDHPSQLMWGSMRKARAVGLFSVAYKFGKEIFQ